MEATAPNNDGSSFLSAYLTLYTYGLQKNNGELLFYILTRCKSSVNDKNQRGPRNALTPSIDNQYVAHLEGKPHCHVHLRNLLPYERQEKQLQPDIVESLSSLKESIYYDMKERVEVSIPQLGVIFNTIDTSVLGEFPFNVEDPQKQLEYFEDVDFDALQFLIFLLQAKFPGTVGKFAHEGSVSYGSFDQYKTFISGADGKCGNIFDLTELQMKQLYGMSKQLIEKKRPENIVASSSIITFKNYLNDLLEYKFKLKKLIEDGSSM